MYSLIRYFLIPVVSGVIDFHAVLAVINSWVLALMISALLALVCSIEEIAGVVGDGLLKVAKEVVLLAMATIGFAPTVRHIAGSSHPHALSLLISATLTWLLHYSVTQMRKALRLRRLRSAFRRLLDQHRVTARKE